MEKNLYEAYDFLPAGSSETEPDQYFVVHNDGTLLINRPVQYVTQDTKEGLDSVQPVVFNASQQYFIDVDSNTELITVSDQFVIPETGNNVYGNNYLLHTIQDEASVQATDNIISKTDSSMAIEEATIETAITANTVQITENTNFTEITINDEQYRMLEKKGWVLIELSNKIFLLNTLGLHDITGNEKLIQELKNESQSVDMTSDTGCEEKLKMSSFTLEEIVTDKLPSEQDTVQLIFGENTVVQTVKMEEATLEKTVQEQLLTNGQGDNEAEKTVSEITETKDTMATTDKEDYTSNCTIVRLKTSFSLKDIPNSIVLGRTPTGKRLVAKVVDVKRPGAKPCHVARGAKPDNGGRHPGARRAGDDKKAEAAEVNETYYKEAEVERLIQQHTGEAAEPLCCSAEDVSGAEHVIKQLLNVATTRAPLIGRNLIVTKIVKTLDASNKLSQETGPVLVTGRVAQFDETPDEWHFIFVPHLLQKLSEDGDGWLVFEGSQSPRRAAPRPRDPCLLHVHVLETRQPPAPPNTHIVLAKRRAVASSNKKLEAIHACRNCAKLFQTEKELNEHLQVQCLDTDEDKAPVLVIDTGKISDKLTNKNSAEGYKKNTCPICNVKFKRANLNKHIKSHFTKEKISDEKPLAKDLENQDTKKTLVPGKYKCKMCPTAYHYASSLSKHILTQHIKSKFQIVSE